MARAYHAPGPCPADILTHSPGVKFLHSLPSEPIPHKPPRLAAGQAHRGAAGGVQLKCRFSLKSTHRKGREERKDIVTLTLRPLRSLRCNIT